MEIGGNPELFDMNWNGLVDDVAVWNRALTTGELRQIWNAGLGIPMTDLIVGTDGDNDGMSDAYESAHGLNPALDDSGLDLDGDGLSNLEEHDSGSDPNNPDTDGDGLEDDAEAAAGTNPLGTDTDGDGLSDGEEISGARNPFLNNVLRDPFDPNTDPPGDPTDPTKSDSDGDDWLDSAEILCKTDPNDVAKFCPFPVPIAYWPLDEVEGNPGSQTTPDKANGHDLNLVNMNAGNLTSGKFGNAFSFSRTAQTMLTRVSGATDSLPITKHPAFTISLWVDATGTGQNDFRFFSEAATGTNTPLFNIGTHNGGANGSVDMYLRNSGGTHGGHDQSLVHPFDGNGWRHIAVVVDTIAQTLTVYIDGVADGGDFTFIDVYTPTMNTTTIGGILRANPSHWVTGGIDDVALWNSALGEEEIKVLADGFLNPLGEPLGALPAIVRITSFGFNGVPLEVSVEGMDPAASYILRRSQDGQSFTDVGAPFTGAATNVFVDPAPPAEDALYQIWTAP
jgi:hypothetical protein